MYRTRTQTLIEKVGDGILAYIISTGMMAVMLTWDVAPSYAHLVTLAFTVVSFIRGYITGRLFNWWFTRR